MSFTKTQKGDWAILLSTVFWSLTPIFVIFTYTALQPLVALGFSTVFAALLFAGMLTFNKRWGELDDPDVWKYLAIISLFIGVLYYGLYFFGLQTTTPDNASLILLMEAFFSYLLFNVWEHEAFGPRYIWGGLLMVVGAALVLFSGHMSLNRGDVYILLATACSPIGNFYQQRLRKRISSEAVLFGRSVITIPVVFILAMLFKEHVSSQAVSQTFWLLFINGFLLLGLSKVLWVEGIHRISVTKAVALESIGPLFTLAFAFLFLHQVPTSVQLLAFVPLSAGLFLLTHKTTPRLHTRT